MKALADKMNNVKVKAQYVLDNTEVVRSQIKITSGCLMLINLAKRDGLKCDCCGDDKLYFTIHEQNGLVLVSSQIYKKNPTPMTMDHNTLKSLNGTDTIENQHLLCMRCNATRGNSFAEYSEFKSWFHKELSYGRNPHNTARFVVQNYCYIDFTKNISSTKNLDHMAKGSVFPPFLRNHLIDMYMKKGKFIRKINSANNSYNFTNEALLTRYNTVAWDELMNYLVMMIIQRDHKFRIDKPNINFSVYKSYNKKMSADDFLNIVHNKIQSATYELGKNVATERQAAIRKKNLAAITQQSKEMLQTVQEEQIIVEEHHNEVVPRFTWWQKIVNAFKVLFV